MDAALFFVWRLAKEVFGFDARPQAGVSEGNRAKRGSWPGDIPFSAPNNGLHLLMESVIFCLGRDENP